MFTDVYRCLWGIIDIDWALNASEMGRNGRFNVFIIKQVKIAAKTTIVLSRLDNHCMMVKSLIFPKTN